MKGESNFDFNKNCDVDLSFLVDLIKKDYFELNDFFSESLSPIEKEYSESEKQMEGLDTETKTLYKIKHVLSIVILFKETLPTFYLEYLNKNHLSDRIIEVFLLLAREESVGIMALRKYIEGRKLENIVVGNKLSNFIKNTMSEMHDSKRLYFIITIKNFLIQMMEKFNSNIDFFKKIIKFEKRQFFLLNFLLNKKIGNDEAINNDQILKMITKIILEEMKLKDFSFKESMQIC